MGQGKITDRELLRIAWKDENRMCRGLNAVLRMSGLVVGDWEGEHANYARAFRELLRQRDEARAIICEVVRLENDHQSQAAWDMLREAAELAAKGASDAE